MGTSVGTRVEEAGRTQDRGSAASQGLLGSSQLTLLPTRLTTLPSLGGWGWGGVTDSTCHIHTQPPRGRGFGDPGKGNSTPRPQGPLSWACPTPPA